MTEHLLQAIGLFRDLKHRKIVCISEVIDKPDSIFIVSQGYHQLLLSNLDLKKGKVLQDSKQHILLVNSMRSLGI